MFFQGVISFVACQLEGSNRRFVVSDEGLGSIGRLSILLVSLIQLKAKEH